VMVALETDTATSWPVYYFECTTTSNWVQRSQVWRRIGCAISAKGCWFSVGKYENFFESGILHRRQHQGKNYEPWTLQPLPTSLSSSKELRDPYQSDCVVNRSALLLLFFEDQVRDAEDGQTSIVPVGRQWNNTWSAETLLEASESTAQIMLN